MERSPVQPDDHPFCSEEMGDDTKENQWRFWQGMDEEADGSWDDEEDFIEAVPEDLPLWMPSAGGAALLKGAGLEDVVNEEIQLRQGQANEALQKLRTHLGHKALLYRINFRSSTSVRTDTRSKQEIQRVVMKINCDVRRYHRARNALARLEASEETMQKYQVITPTDLGVSKDVTEENRFGQSSDALPWFWQIGDMAHSSSSTTWDDECESLHC